MKSRFLGNSGLEVSALALGSYAFGDPGRGTESWTLPEAESLAILRSAIEAGVTFFDTANVYSHGHSEEILGRAVRAYAERDAVVLATKVWGPMRRGPNALGLSRVAIMREIDASLRRLGVDHVDLWQVHRWDDTTPVEETMEALHDVVRAGKVRYLGASSMHAWQFAKAQHVALTHGWTPYVSMQGHHNLLYREEEREMLPLCRDQGVGVIPWSPLARGRLARAWDVTTQRSGSDPYVASLYAGASAAADRAVVDAVGAVAASRGVSRAQVALAWVSAQPGVTAPVVGVSRLSHLTDAIASMDLTLTADEIAALEAPYGPRAVDWGS